MIKLQAARPLRLFAAGALMLFAGMAQAQYVWIDEKGIKQFSDRSPPSSIPLKNILKQPGGVKGPVLIDTQAPPPADPVETKPKGPPTLAERNAEYKKRAKEQAENAQKAAAQAENKEAQKENCNSARQAKAQLDAGTRVADTDKNGERTFISDAERARRVERADKAVAACAGVP